MDLNWTIPDLSVLPLEALYSDLYKDTPAQQVRGTTVDTTVTQPYLTTQEVLKKLGREAWQDYY